MDARERAEKEVKEEAFIELVDHFKAKLRERRKVGFIRLFIRAFREALKEVNSKILS